MSATETRLQSWILAQLKDRYPESVFDRQNVVAMMAKNEDSDEARFVRSGTPGQGDIRGCHKGRYLELEVKRPGSGQSKKQKARQIAIQRAGGVYAVVRTPTEAFAVLDPL